MNSRCLALAFLLLASPAWAATLSLPAAIRKALAHDPALSSALHQTRAQEAETRLAGCLPNPTLEAEAEEIGGQTDARTAFWLRQALPINGVREAEIDAASAREKAARSEAQVTEREVVFRVKNAYHGVLLGEARTRLAQDALNLAQEVQRVAKRRVEAQASPEMDLLRATSEVENLRLQAELARKGVEQARIALGTLIGEDPVSLQPLETPSLPPLSTLLAGLDGNPTLEASRWKQASAEAELKAAKANTFANPEIGVGVVRRVQLGDNLLSTTIGWPLPRWQNREEISRAEALLAKSQTEERNDRRGLTLALRESYAEYENAQRTVRLYEEKLIPTNREAFRRTTLSYRLGRSPYLDLLDTRRRVTETENALLDAKERLFRAAFRVDSMFARKEK